MTIYISGPITHATGPDRFSVITRLLESQGHRVINPKMVPACPDHSCELLPHEIEKNFEHSWACYLRHDLVALLRYCDTILMMDGWQDSHGAREELHAASLARMRILFEKDIL